MLCISQLRIDDSSRKWNFRLTGKPPLRIGKKAYTFWLSIIGCTGKSPLIPVLGKASTISELEMPGRRDSTGNLLAEWRQTK